MSIIDYILLYLVIRYHYASVTYLIGILRNIINYYNLLQMQQCGRRIDCAKSNTPAAKENQQPRTMT